MSREYVLNVCKCGRALLKLRSTKVITPTVLVMSGSAPPKPDLRIENTDTGFNELNCAAECV